MSAPIEGLPVDHGPLDAGWVTLAELADTRFDIAKGYFAAAVAGSPGLDLRGQGAYFIGTLAFYAAAALAAPALAGEMLPDIDAHSLAVTPTDAGAMSLRYRISDDVGPTDTPIGEIMERTFAPLIERIKIETRLAEPAQWRLVADGIASGSLLVGEARSCMGEAQVLGLATVRDPRFKPFNGLTGYLEVEGSVFLKRGGCCRYYTADEGSYCATCILREPGDQIVELKRYLAEVAAG